MFAATAQGVWRSDDGGKTWTAKAKGLPSTEVRAFAGGSNAKAVMLYVSVTAKNEGGKHVGGVYRSADRGETWESAMGQGINKDIVAADEWSMGPVAQYIDLLTTDVKPNAVWAMNTNTGVRVPHHTACFRSDDAGKTWRATFYPDPRFTEYNVEPEYMSVADGQFYQGPIRAAIDNKNPDRVLLVMGKAFFTEDGGKTWKCAHTRKAGEADGEPLWKCTGLVVTTTWNYYFDPFDHKRQYIAYTDIGYARSTDGGKTWRWSKQKEQPPWRNTCYEMAFEPAQKGKIWGAFSNTHDIPNGNIIGNYHRDSLPGGVCLSTDYGRSWKISNSGLPAVSVRLGRGGPEEPARQAHALCQHVQRRGLQVDRRREDVEEVERRPRRPDEHARLPAGAARGRHALRRHHGPARQEHARVPEARRGPLALEGRRRRRGSASRRRTRSTGSRTSRSTRRTAR